MNLLKEVFVLTSQVKIPYYPKVVASQRETTFGAVEISCPTIYDKPLDGILVARIDLLESLKPMFGCNCFVYRDMLYKFVSGSCENQQEHVDLFASFYRRYHDITAYINDLYYYGNDEIPIIPRVLNEVRDIINQYREEVTEIMYNSGGKYLVHTHDYLYYGFKSALTIPEMKGLTVIC